MTTQMCRMYYERRIMENIKEYINSYYTSNHYAYDEIIEANEELIKWLSESNEELRKEWR